MKWRAVVAQISYLVLTAWLVVVVLHFVWPGVVSWETANTIFGIGIILYFVGTVGLKRPQKKP